MFTIAALVVCHGLLLAAGTFSGSVTEAHSTSPVRGARIKVKQAGAARLTADLETGFDGRFKAEAEIPPGAYRIDISKPNHASASLQITLPLSGGLAVKLVRFGTISGRVADSSNRPLPGAFVMPMVAAGDSAEGAHYRPLHTGSGTAADGNGNYRIFNLPPGRYALAVTWASMSGVEPLHAGAYLYPSNSRPRLFAIGSGTAVSGIDFTLPAQSEFSISGRVTGIAPPGKRSAVALVLRDQPALAVAMKHTESDGAFRFDRIAPGAYELRAAAPTGGYAGFGAVLDGSPLFGRRPVDVAGQNVADAEVALAPARSLKLIADSKAPECAGSGAVSVSLDPLEHWGSLLFKSVDLAPNRETAVKDLAPIKYRVSVTKAPEGCFGPHGVVAGADGPGPVRISIVPGGSIAGRVEGGAPGALVMLRDLDDAAQPDRAALPATGGRYRFEGLRPGRYRVEAGPPENTISHEVTVRSAQETEAVLRIVEKRQ